MPSLTHPLRFVPLLKRIRWGGTRLGTVLHKPLGTATDYAESWEVCDHGADQSRVVSRAGTRFAGKTLHELVLTHGAELFGRQAGYAQFPLLFKYLDVCDRLSVQVHPNDGQASRFCPGENGKNEAWYILDARPDSLVYVGLKAGVGQQELTHALEECDVERCLHPVHVEAGDCLFIPTGTVHAVGDGVLMAEVQQSSDATFRLYDWGRFGTDGKPRSLHIAESLECIDFQRGPVQPVEPVSLTATLPPASVRHELDLLVRCPFFEVRRHRAESPFDCGGENDCRVLMVVAGEGKLTSGTAEKIEESLRIGDTILLPAAAGPVRITPRDELVVLETLLPERGTVSQ